MNRVSRTSSPRAAASAGVRLGERLRQLRVAAGLTQSELAGARFSKEYVSQIERGKTRPARESVVWLAERLGVDADFLANGVTADQRGRVETALALFDEALSLADASGLPCDHLRASIFSWRARCYRRQRDLEAAREDVERALELAEGLDDPRTTANVLFDASIIAEREGHWVLARTYAERAKAKYEELTDRANVGRLLNNLGALNFLLGKPDEAVSFLKDAFRVALELENDAEAAGAVSSLAQV